MFFAVLMFMFMALYVHNGSKVPDLISIILGARLKPQICFEVRLDLLLLLPLLLDVDLRARDAPLLIRGGNDDPLLARMRLLVGMHDSPHLSLLRSVELGTDQVSLVLILSFQDVQGNWLVLQLDHHEGSVMRVFGINPDPEHIVLCSLGSLGLQHFVALYFFTGVTHFYFTVFESNSPLFPKRKWLLPKNTNEPPVALLIRADEAESLQRHRLPIELDARVNKLIGRHPLGEGAGILPHVLVVLAALLDARRVVVVAVIEGATGTF